MAEPRDSELRQVQPVAYTRRQVDENGAFGLNDSDQQHQGEAPCRDDQVQEDIGG